MTVDLLSNRFPLSAHLGYLFQDVPLPSRFEKARAAGFRAIELANPYGLSLQQFRSLCEENGLEVAQIALPNGTDGPAKKGFAAQHGLRPQFEAALKLCIEFATAVNCRAIHPMAGTGTAREASPQWNAYLSNLEQTCVQADKAGLKVVIEAISEQATPNYFMNSIRLACTAIDQIAAPNLFLLLDTYHAAAMNVELASFILEHGARIGHVQVADWPGRHEPCSAQIDFGEVFDALGRSGYEGFIGLEYHPTTEAAEAFDWVRCFDAYLCPIS